MALAYLAAAFPLPRQILYPEPVRLSCPLACVVDADARTSPHTRACNRRSILKEQPNATQVLAVVLEGDAQGAAELARPICLHSRWDPVSSLDPAHQNCSCYALWLGHDVKAVM